jgi:hypothetical protein
MFHKDTVESERHAARIPLKTKIFKKNPDEKKTDTTVESKRHAARIPLKTKIFKKNPDEKKN